MHTEALVRHESDPPTEGWDDERGRLTWRTLFSADSTPTNTFVTGVADVPADGFLALHRHAQAETYYVVSGEGIVTLNDVETLMRPGVSVHIPGSAEHGVRNTGTEPLRFFYVLAADSFADVEYVFS
jgi:mannose-6-phosphate isomerase-like protein (cupin superfamily)